MVKKLTAQMNTLNYTSDYQRIEEIKKFLQIGQNTELAEFFGIKNSQIFSEIKRGRHGISKKLASAIVDKIPAINYSWLLTGDGDMLRAGNVVNAQGDNHGATIAGGNVTTTGDGNRLLAIIEEQTKTIRQQADERATLLAIVQKLTSKLTLFALLFAVPMLFAGCKKEKVCKEVPYHEETDEYISEGLYLRCSDGTVYFVNGTRRFVVK